MLRTVKGQSVVLLGWETFVSVFLCFPSAGHHPPTGLSPGSSLTLWLINGSWRCPVISSPNNKLQPKVEAPLRPTVNIPILTTRRQPITLPLAHRLGNACCGHLVYQGHNLRLHRQAMLVTQWAHIKFIQRFKKKKSCTTSTRYIVRNLFFS